MWSQCGSHAWAMGGLRIPKNNPLTLLENDGIVKCENKII